MTQSDQTTSLDSPVMTTTDFLEWGKRVAMIYSYAETWRQIAAREERKMRQAIFIHMNTPRIKKEDENVG